MCGVWWFVWLFVSLMVVCTRLSVSVVWNSVFWLTWIDFGLCTVGAAVVFVVATFVVYGPFVVCY